MNEFKVLKVLKVMIELQELKVLKVQDKGSFRRWCDSLFAPLLMAQCTVQSAVAVHSGEKLLMAQCTMLLAQWRVDSGECTMLMAQCCCCCWHSVLRSAGKSKSKQSYSCWHSGQWTVLLAQCTVQCAQCIVLLP